MHSSYIPFHDQEIGFTPWQQAIRHNLDSFVQEELMQTFLIEKCKHIGPMQLMSRVLPCQISSHLFATVVDVDADASRRLNAGWILPGSDKYAHKVLDTDDPLLRLCILVLLPSCSAACGASM